MVGAADLENSSQKSRKLRKRTNSQVDWVNVLPRLRKSLRGLNPKDM